MPWQAGEPQRSERCWETATQQIMPASLQSRPGKGNLGLRSCQGNSSLSPKASLGCEGWEQGETLVAVSFPQPALSLGRRKQEPLGRGAGLGRGLVAFCVHFPAGTRPWTVHNAVLPPSLWLLPPSGHRSYSGPSCSSGPGLHSSFQPICRHFTLFVLEPAMSFS